MDGLRRAALATAALGGVVTAALAGHGAAATATAARPSPPAVAAARAATGAPVTARAASPVPARAATVAAATGSAYPDSGQPAALPAYHLPAAAQDSCDSQRIPHPSGFGVAQGDGTDSFARAGGQSGDSGPVEHTHLALQFVCLNPTAGGGLEFQLFATPLDSDTSTYDLTVGPGGLVVNSITPGSGFSPVVIGRRVGGWPGGCSEVTATGSGAQTATIDDTLCFARDGSFQSATLRESVQRADGSYRRLAATLRFEPQG